MNMYENEYSDWKNKKKEEKVPFFPIYNEFLPYLRDLTPGAISLYIFFGIHSKSYTGDSFYKIESIADFFGKSTRTISNWISELENAGLIVRKQKKFNSVSITYLRPY